MTNSKSGRIILESEGVPVVANIWHTEVIGDSVYLKGQENMTEYFKQHLISEGDFTELVRRKDVQTFIQDKIEAVEINPVREEYAAKQSEILQELLEELEQ